MKASHDGQASLARFFYGIFFGAFFCLLSAGPAFPAEDIVSLMSRGDEAIARGDFEQARSIGRRIVTEDPRNLKGYGFSLIYCMATGRELEFNRIVEEAQSRLDSVALQALLIKMVAEILFVGNQSWLAYEKSYEYEMKWHEAYDKSR